MFNKYHKISAPFIRDMDTGKLTTEYAREDFQYLADKEWMWTEKVDGMNIRIYWDGYEITIGGRTEKSVIPPELMEYLSSIFLTPLAHQKFENYFADNEVILFGEGYGGKIQSGYDYSKQMKFILFDVMINGTYKCRTEVKITADIFDLKVVPILLLGTIPEAIKTVRTLPLSEVAENERIIEGYVGRPMIELNNIHGERVITKIKVRDFKDSPLFKEF